MSKILMVDYYGTCDEHGNAIGHSPKAAREYRELFSVKDTVDLAASSCIASEVKDAGFSHIYPLPYNIVETDYNKLSKRILDKFKLFINIHHVLRMKGYELLWFYRVDFFLLLYMIFARRKKNKRICLVYQMGAGTGWIGKIADFVYKAGITRFDGVIYTQPKMRIPADKTFYMPDYWYKKEKYECFAVAVKEEKAVCLGAMNPYKQLEELVDVFNRSGYPLEITGYFFDKERALRLREKAEENILIEDRILSEEEYYERLGSARFAVLPYDMKQYKNRTSGILLESAFLGVIPVAPEELLKTNEFAGIGYRDMAELEGDMMKKECISHIIESNNKKIRTEYDESAIKTAFAEWSGDL